MSTLDIGKIAGVSTATPPAVNGNQQDPDDLFSEDDELINDLFNAEDVSQGTILALRSAGMRIRFWQKTGSKALHFKLREIFKSLLDEYFR